MKEYSLVTKIILTFYLVMGFGQVSYAHVNDENTDEYCANLPPPETCEDVVEYCGTLYDEPCSSEDLSGYSSCLEYYQTIFGGKLENWGLTCPSEMMGPGAKTFTLNYEVIQAKGVCWQTCRHSGCEESEYDVFYDKKTYAKLQEAKIEGKKFMRENRATCNIGGVARVNEHMLAINKKNPVKAEKIVQKQGSVFNMVIYSDTLGEIDKFLKNLLN